MRTPLGAALAGAGMGLGLGAIFLSAGMAGHAADHAHATRMTEAAADGYARSHLEAQSAGLRAGLQRYGVRDPADALKVSNLFPAEPARQERAASKAKTRSELECLTEAVYYEARGEGSRGQYAVAQVVMNRVKHPAFPNSVCAVVFQGAGRRGCQFSFACNGAQRGRRETEAWARAKGVATRALAGAALADVGSATHFHSIGVSPIWAPQMARVSQVGMHVFYRFSPRKLRPAQPAPAVEHAVLTSDASGEIPALSLTPAVVEKAVEGSLQPTAATAPAAPTADAKAKRVQPAPAPGKPMGKPAEAVELTTPQTVVAGAS